MIDEILTQQIIYGDTPPKGVYFTVTARFWKGSSKPVETLPSASFGEAMLVAEELAAKLAGDIEDGELMEIDPEDNDGSHLVVVQNDEPVATLTINTYDIRKETRH